MQKDTNGAWHPCAFLSHSFTAAERNYKIYDRELLAIIKSLETWRHYLHGSTFPIIILTDHKNLTYFRTAQQLNRRQARWSLFLSEFDIQLIHVPGTQMTISDTLSRRPDYSSNGQQDNANITLLPDNLFIRLIDAPLRDAILMATPKDKIIFDALTALKTGGPLPMKSSLSDWRMEEDLVFFKDRCYVPPDPELRRKIVQRYHDHVTAGHPGVQKTLELLRRDYWWPGSYIFVQKYVEGYATCQQAKVQTHPTTPPLLPIPSTPDVLPFTHCSVDFITDLPTSNGFDSLMVVVDHGLTKGVILIPCNKTIDALGTAHFFHLHVYRRFGLHSSLISDRGPQFTSKVSKEMGRLLGIQIKLSTAYHPQTDGETERVNQEIEVFLRIFCGNHPEQWADRISQAEFTHNHRTHSARKQSPFFLMMGYNPRALPAVFPKTHIPSVEHRLSKLVKIRDEAIAAHELARQQMKGRTRKDFIPFKLGDKVWLEAKNLKTGNPHRKLGMKKEGPFEISEVLGPVTYRLALPKTWRIHPVFHACLLSPYKENNIHGPNFPRPPPDLIDNEEEFEVEAILNHQKRGNSTQYLVKWKGYPSSENSWQKASDLDHSQELLKTYKDLHRL